MAEHSKFFDSSNPLDPDKVYTADEFMGFFGKLITDGVMKGEANMLKVETSGSNMNTIVDTGTAFLKAREYENDSKLSLTHEVEALGKSRIDRVVIRLMLNVDYREARAFVKKGVAGVAPVAPQLERTDEVYEISLAQVRVIGGQTYINVADIVDERGNPDVCPWAGSKILPNFDDTALEGLVTGFNSHILKKSSLSEDGHVKLNNTLTGTSITEAATANAVKTVNDKLIGKAVKIGLNAVATGPTDIAIGEDARAIGGAIGNIAIGHKASATGESSVAIGYFATAINKDMYVLGRFNNKVEVPGSFSVAGTKQFIMAHPHPDKKDTHVLRHSAVESPTAGDNLYRYTIEAATDGETIEIQLPDYFQYLNKNVDVYANGDGHFGNAFGRVEGDILKVSCQLAGSYKVLVIGTRNDDHDSVQTWDIKGVEREIGESWTGETYVFEVDEITEVSEFEEAYQ
ncbi:tail fiber protein [Sporosarcina psychrophila]|uniref:Trimeric autotransporter adhesin YadA-like head domain-containing protein n=1 Tax=Sporosarcina psychrophila TaxID=1476 RepID=A0ABV2KBA5_SPOPS